MSRSRLDKAIQAVGVLLQQEGVDQDAYLKVLKLLYIADRESLTETGTTITGDLLVAMPHGPAPSYLCDLMRGQATDSRWSQHFVTNEPFKIRPLLDPGTQKLCPYELRKLKEVSERHKDDNRWAMERITHQLPEWRKNNPGESSKPIPLDDVLEAVGRAADAEAIKRDAREHTRFAKLLDLLGA